MKLTIKLKLLINSLKCTPCVALFCFGPSMLFRCMGYDSNRPPLYHWDRFVSLETITPLQQNVSSWRLGPNSVKRLLGLRSCAPARPYAGTVAIYLQVPGPEKRIPLAPSELGLRQTHRWDLRHWCALCEGDWEILSLLKFPLKERGLKIGESIRMWQSVQDLESRQKCSKCSFEGGRTLTHMVQLLLMTSMLIVCWSTQVLVLTDVLLTSAHCTGSWGSHPGTVLCTR